MVVVVPTQINVNNLPELIEFTKQNDNQLSFGTSGAGSSQHLAGILMGQALSLNLIHVPYKGGSAALNDILGAHVPMGILALSNVIPYIKTGKLKSIGVIESHRSITEPQIPTLSEAGISGFSVPDTWVGFLAPTGLPKSILDRLHQDIATVSEQAEVKKKMETAGFETSVKSPDAFKEILNKSVALYKKTVTDANIKPE
jgi:tripartite-type tricarboxylate transporter receptor subunit TctC